MEIIADHGRMTSFEIVEVNPVIDEHNRTADLAVELAMSAFRQRKYCDDLIGGCPAIAAVLRAWWERDRWMKHEIP